MSLPRRAAAVLAVALAAAPAGADWLQPDASVREAQFVARMAARDTTGRGDDPARLDSLAIARFRLGEFDAAAGLFRRVLELAPGDDLARAGLGRIALFRDRAAEADSLLAAVAVPDASVRADRFAAAVRLGRYAEAAASAAEVGQAGRAGLLNRLAESPPYAIAAGPGEETIPLARTFPTPLIKVMLNGERVLMAVDTGASDLLIDDVAFRRLRLPAAGGEYSTFWMGSRVTVRGALVPRIEIGGFRIENCPAGVLNLGRWSREVNPQYERVAGVIGLGLLRRFTPTLDLGGRVLVLRRAGAPVAAAAAQRVPFELWGEAELMLRGSIGQGRPMAFVFASGLPGGALGAPPTVMEEVGVKPGPVSRARTGLGALLQGRAWAPVRLPAVAVGPVARDRLSGWSGALDPVELWRHGVRRDAVLGGEFFRGRRVTFDWAERVLLVEE
jgi:predicted aspartyl protease